MRHLLATTLLLALATPTPAQSPATDPPPMDGYRFKSIDVQGNEESLVFFSPYMPELVKEKKKKAPRAVTA